MRRVADDEDLAPAEGEGRRARLATRIFIRRKFLKSMMCCESNTSFGCRPKTTWVAHR